MVHRGSWVKSNCCCIFLIDAFYYYHHVLWEKNGHVEDYSNKLTFRAVHYFSAAHIIEQNSSVSYPVFLPILLFEHITLAFFLAGVLLFIFSLVYWRLTSNDIIAMWLRRRLKRNRNVKRRKRQSDSHIFSLIHD